MQREGQHRILVASLENCCQYLFPSNSNNHCLLWPVCTTSKNLVNITFLGYCTSTFYTLHVQFESLRGAGVLEFLSILYNGTAELNLARGMGVCPCRSGRQRPYDGLILLSKTSYSMSQWDLENLGLSSTLTAEPKKSENDKYEQRNHSYGRDTSSSDVAS
jgi:hypothetical protein